MLRYLKVHIQTRKKKWSTAETAADHFALHGSSLALTFYSPFCRGDTLIYIDLCEPKSFELFKIWRYMDIYEDTLPMGAPSIPNFIKELLLFSLSAFHFTIRRRKVQPRSALSAFPLCSSPLCVSGGGYIFVQGSGVCSIADPVKLAHTIDGIHGIIGVYPDIRIKAVPILRITGIDH